MKILHTILLTLIVLSGLVLLVPASSSAFNPLQTACNSGSNDATSCKDTNTTTNPIVGTNGIITKAVQLIALITGIAAVIVIIIAGIRFVLSGGDATKVATAKSTILYAVVGLIVAALAQSLVIFVLNKF
jgi:hypothetical protein